MQERVQKKSDLARSAMIPCAVLLLALCGLSACLPGCGSDEGGSDGASGSSAAGGSSGTGGASGSGGTSGSGGVADGGSSAGSAGSAGDTGGLGQPCYSNETCDAPYVCEGGMCVEQAGEEGGLGQPCYSNGTCDVPYVCDGGTCMHSETIHDFTGLPLTADGWTDFTAMFAHPDHYNDSRVIYVSSSSGNDGTGQHYAIGDQAVGADPLNPSGTIQPYATLQAGYSQLRDGYPDLLLLERGDVWAENLPEWRKSGRSQAELMMLASYGPFSLARPKIGTFRTGWGGSHPERAFSHTFLVGIEFGSMSRQVFGDNFFIEDCATKKGQNTGMVISAAGGPINNVVVRRSVIAERYPTDSTGHTQGIYSSGVNGFLLEENVFDHNGWTSDSNEGNPATSRNHNTYFDIGVKDAVMRYNISSRSSSKGFQPGGGGLVEANLSVYDPIGIESSRAENYYPDGLHSIIKDNVILESWDSKSSSITRWGMMFNNVASSWVEGNIFGSATEGAGRVAIHFWVNERNGTWMRIRNVTLKDNIIHNWRGSVYIRGLSGAGASWGIENVLIQDNAVHNELSSDLIAYRPETAAEITSKDNAFYADRDNDAWLADYATAVGDTTSVISQTTPSGGYLVTDYLSSIGETATLDAFFARIQQQRRGNWDDRYTAVPIINFVRGKFDKDPIGRVY